MSSGPYLANYRAYDPSIGRWISEDPIGEAGGINLYQYVNGNPVPYIDPAGLAQPSPQIALEQAIVRGDIEEIKMLLEAGETIDQEILGQCVKRRAGNLVQELKESGRGAGARSGQHGTPYKQAGAQLVREGNRIPGPVGQSLKDAGNRLIDKGNAINH